MKKKATISLGDKNGNFLIFYCGDKEGRSVKGGNHFGDPIQANMLKEMYY